MKATTRAALAALVMVAPLVGAVSAGTPAQAGSRSDGRLLGQLSSTRWFSPDNSKAKDTVEVGIRMKRRASVSITVRREGKGWVARRVSLGSVKAGRRVWRWDGRTDGGRIVQDGNYRVEVVATSRQGDVRRQHATTRVKSRRAYTLDASNLPTLEVDRTTLPTGGTVAITAFQRVEDRTPFGRDRSFPLLNGLTIYSNGGGAAVVAGYPIVRDVSDPVRTWTATTPTGAPLPPGSYTLVSHVVDSYGNNGTLAQELTVTP